MTSGAKRIKEIEHSRTTHPTTTTYVDASAGSLAAVPDRHSESRVSPRDEAATSSVFALIQDSASADNYPSGKRVVDVIGTIVLATVFSPLIIAVVLVLSRTGGVLYKHRRVGAGGRVFECLKFRTMIPDAERVLKDILASDDALKAEWVLNHKLRNDPRVTWIGRFLRKTSLDELPQLWNVLRGDMSLVGPRPVVREELLRYGRSASTYVLTRPGITGLWQTLGRSHTEYRRRVAMDVYYIRNQTFWLDLWILARTTTVVLGGSGAY